MAVLKEKDHIVDLFAECKFRNRKIGIGVLNELSDRVEFVKPQATVRYALFSISGFEDDHTDEAEETGAILVDMNRLIGRTDL